MHAHSTHTTGKNQLPASELLRFSSHLQLVPVLAGECLSQPDQHVKYVYFPITAIVSLLYLFESGSSAEIAVVGNEGILSISVFMGGDTNSRPWM